ncbi:uncharacterized protein VTP21DRAFT_8040 [Calcarisporiella thermophila]|uniref:uncharacterized protein n=1 Tax=Calcarisporiella thermophila TaxID=911321 RepID=UPI003744394F
MLVSTSPARFPIPGSLPSHHKNLISLFRYQAGCHPDKPILLFPDADSKYYEPISYYQFDLITNREARRWASRIKFTRKGSHSSEQNPVALLSQSVPSYLHTMFAFFKLRVPLLLISPSNSPLAVEHMIRESGSCALIIDPELKHLVTENLSVPVLLYQCFSLDELAAISADKDEFAPLANDEDTSEEEIAFIVHSSGSSGFPKLIRLSNKSVIYSGALLQTVDDYPGNMHDTTLITVPIFHGFGNHAAITQICLFGATVALPLRKTWPLGPADVLEGLAKSNATILYIIPSLLEEVGNELRLNSGESHKDSTWELLRRLKFIGFAGAPLSIHVLELMNDQGVNVVAIFGSSESGLIMTGVFRREMKKVLPDASVALRIPWPVRYRWIEHPDVGGGVKELVILSDNPMSADMPINTQEGDYRTGDLFVERNGYYYILNRLGNILVHSNGEKTDPLPMEMKLCEHHLIEKAIVIGHNRVCTAALIQLESARAERLPLLEVVREVEQAVSIANINAPRHSRILPEMIYVFPLRGKKFPLSDKGSVLRKRVDIELAEEIKQLYSRFLEGSEHGIEPAGLHWANIPEDTKCRESIREQLREILISILRPEKAALITGSNKWESLGFFDSLGMDSLDVTRLRNRIIQTYPPSKLGHVLSLSFIYQCTTIEALIDHIENSRLYKHEARIMSTEADKELSYIDAQQLATTELINKYSNFSGLLGQSQHQTHELPEKGAIVLLTGATGSLGAFVLYGLLLKSIEKVRKVYCLVRDVEDEAHAFRRVQKSFKKYQLDPMILDQEENHGRLVVLSGYDMSDSKLGQSQEVFQQLQQEVTDIFHIAWMLSFNVPVQAYANECLPGIYNLIALAISSTRPKRILYTSSVGACLNYRCLGNGSIVPETGLPENHPEVAVNSGYGLSKYASEQILLRSAVQLGLNIVIARIGQICGDSKSGIWTKIDEMISMLTIYAPTVMRAMPDLDGILQIDWVPVDIVADSLLELSLDTTPSRQQAMIYHIVNPHPVPWSTLVNALQSVYRKDPFMLLPPEEWLALLKRYEGENVSIEKGELRNPLVRLIPFFESVLLNPSAYTKNIGPLTFETHQSCRASPSLRSCEAFDENLLRKYMEYWRDKGLLKLQPH